MAQPPLRLWATVLGAPDPRALGAFYARLLGWRIEADEPEWVTVKPPSSESSGLSFQLESNYQRPVWPEEPGKQQMLVHLDIKVDDVEAAVAWAQEVGATLADWQPQDNVRVMLDPAGHPFCLFVN